MTGVQTCALPIYKLHLIPKVTLPRHLTLRNVAFPLQLWRTQRAALKVVKGASLVIGFGGYVSAPVYLAAKRLGVPIVIHEANARPGFANRLGRSFAKIVAVNFDSVRAAWPGAGARAVYVVRPTTGDPTAQAARTASRAGALAEAGVDTTAAEDHRDGEGVPARGVVLANVRDDETLRVRLSTVDDFDIVEGRVASILSSADLGRGVSGRYGFGAGAEAPMPAWWAP